MANGVPYSIRQLPIIGDLSSKLGQIIDINTNPCTPTPEIIVTAAFKNLPMLLWSLYKPDPFDMVTERFGMQHHRKKKGRFKISDHMLGGKIPGVGGVGFATFTLGSLAERLGWYFLIVDATADFLINWSSTVYEWSGCPIPGTPYAKITGRDVYFLYTEGVYDNVAVFENPQYQLPFTATFAHVNSSPGWDCAVSSFLQWRSDPGTVYGRGVISEVKLIDYAQNEEIFGGPARDDGDNNHGYAGIFKNPAISTVFKSYAHQITVTTSGWFNFHGSALSLAGHISEGLLPDP